MLSNEWKHQPDVDRAGDEILAEGKVTLDTITAYQVAGRLGRSANPVLYAKFRDWRARRQADAEPVTVDLPPEVEAEIRAIFDRLSTDGVNACLGAVRTVGSNLDRVAMLRVTFAERRADVAEAEVTTVLALGETAENERHAAMIRIGELEQALADAQRREDRLAGRLEQREVDLAAALQNRTRGDTSASTPPADSADCDGVSNTVDAPDRVESVDAGDAGDAAGTCPAQSAAATPTAQLLLTFYGSAGESDADDDARHD